MKQILYSEFKDLFSKGEVYFINSYENAAIRSQITENGTKYFVKFKGKNEFQAKDGSNVVAGGFEEHTIISKQEYDNF